MRMVVILRSLRWLMKQEMLDDEGREVLKAIEDELEMEQGEADAERDGDQGRGL